jgi:hypothetical protein
MLHAPAAAAAAEMTLEAAAAAADLQSRLPVAAAAAACHAAVVAAASAAACGGAAEAAMLQLPVSQLQHRTCGNRRADAVFWYSILKTIVANLSLSMAGSRDKQDGSEPVSTLLTSA